MLARRAELAQMRHDLAAVRENLRVIVDRVHQLASRVHAHERELLQEDTTILIRLPNSG